MLYSDIIAVHSQIHTKHINTVCGQNVELLNVTLNGTCSDHWASGGKRCRSHHQSAGLPVPGRCQSVPAMQYHGAVLAKPQRLLDSECPVHTVTWFLAGGLSSAS